MLPLDAVIVGHNLSVGLLNGVFVHRCGHVVLEINNEIMPGGDWRGILSQWQDASISIVKVIQSDQISAGAI